jgi:hypothetical protein
VFAVVEQPSGVSQGLVAAKSRLAKQQLTIPRQKLVSAHTACNLVHNVKQALEGFPVSDVHGWLDSTIALHWLKGGGEYKQSSTFEIEYKRSRRRHTSIGDM